MMPKGQDPTGTGDFLVGAYRRMDMTLFRILQAGMMLQILLGLWRFLAPYAGLPMSGRLWMIHPLLGITIASVALVLFRPRKDVGANPQWTASRYVALAPLALGLAMRYGVVTGLMAIVTHMVLGLTALGLIDSAIKKEGRRRSRATTENQAPSETPQTV